MKRRTVTYAFALIFPFTFGSCAWQQPLSYNPYRQEYNGPRLTGKLGIMLTVRPEIMIAPKEAWLTAKIEGELPDCATMVIEWGDGCTSTRDMCGLSRIFHGGHSYHAYGSLKPLIYLMDGGKVLARGSTALQIGAPE